MKRWLGRFWRLGKVVVLLALLVLAAWAWLLPAVVAWQIEQQLTEAGADYASVRVHRVGLRTVEIGSLVIGTDERLSFDAATVSYDPRELRDGRIDTLSITGAQLVLTLADGRLDLGRLGDLDFGNAAPADWPFNKIELHHSALLIETGAGLVRLPVQGLISASDRRLTLGLTAEGVGERARLTGQVERRADGWTTDNLRLIAHADDAYLADQPVRNARADVILRGGMGPDHIRLELVGGSNVTADRLGDLPRNVAARVGAEPVELTIDRADGAWSIAGPEVTLSAATGAVAFGETKADRLAVSTTLRLVGDGERLRAWTTEPTVIEATGTRTGQLAVEAERWQLEAAAGDEDAPPTLAWHADRKELSFAGQLTGSTVDLTAAPARDTADAEADGGAAATWSAGSEALVVAVSGVWSPQGALAATGQIELTAGHFAHPASDTVAEGIDAIVPLSLGEADGDADAAPPTGSFTVRRVRWADADLPGPTGSAAVAGGRATFDAEWQPIVPMLVSLAGTADAAGVQLTAEAERFELVDPLRLAQTLPALEGWEIDGAFAARAEWTFDGRAWEPRASIDLADVAVRSRAWEAQLRGIDGTVSLERFGPPFTPPDQRLTIASAEIGELRLTDGLVGFRVESAREVLIERMRWTFGRQSQFRLHSFRFNADETEIDTEIFVERMNLDDWLGVLTDDAVTGSGELYGRIPVTLRPQAPRRKFVLGSGFLYSKPGTGTLRVRDAEMADMLLAQADPRFAEGAQGRELRERIIEALTDFEYSMVTFDLVETAGDLALRMETRGRGRRGEAPLDIASLVVNVRGFGTRIDEALWVGMTLQRSVDRALESFFDRARP